MQILASVEAAKIFLGARGAKGKPLPDCHFWSFSGAGDVSGAHENIKRRACAVRRANTPPITLTGVIAVVIEPIQLPGHGRAAQTDT